jgi:hypothetical protein
MDSIQDLRGFGPVFPGKGKGAIKGNQTATVKKIIQNSTLPYRNPAKVVKTNRLKLQPRPREQASVLRPAGFPQRTKIVIDIFEKLLHDVRS